MLMVIGNRISSLLGERRENISDFSRNAGISYPVAFNLYHGKGSGITWEIMNKVCNYFKLGPGEIFPWEPDKAKVNSDE